MKNQLYIWDLFSVFRSTEFAQEFLFKSYRKNGFQNAEILSYDNCYPFIYYLEHGQNYYQLAKSSPISIQPVLLFYGMVQLLKGCLITINPNYPENTSVLAHGVSTRKRKKRDYEFSNDEVKIQKNGLFPHFSEKMFHVKQLEGEKFSMKSLFNRIPEMNDLFEFHDQTLCSQQIGSESDRRLYLSASILDDLNMTFDRFEQFMQQRVPFKHSLEHIDKQKIMLELDKPISPIHCSPFQFHFYTRTFYIPTKKEHFSPISEIMAHYLLLYNLSMICRYETEWWSDLLHSYTGKDYPYIIHFLSLTMDKMPCFLYQYLKYI